MTTRRHFLSSAAAATALTSLELTGCLRPTTSPPPPPALPTLRETGSSRGILAGCAADVPRLRDDPAYAALVSNQAGIVVAENSFKFGPLRPTPTTFFFDDADYLLSFAEKSGIKVRGHNFVWHRSLPKWFDDYVTPGNAGQLLVNHIETVAGRYSGRIHSWDVVNEAILLDDKLPNGLRNTPWYQALGPNYLDLAFTTARRADPHALLVYNDYGIESEIEPAQRKRDAVMALLRSMKSRNIPIDALGIQSHLDAGPKHVNGPGLTAMIKDCHSLGLKVLLTEMDVNDRELPPDVPQRDATVAARYTSYLNLALANPAVIALLTWGITDKYTWLNGKIGRHDKLPERPLLFDADLQPKPAFYAEIEALRNAPLRT